MLKQTGRTLLLAAILAGVLVGCEGTRSIASGAKATGHGFVTVMEYPSKLLAGHPKDYAKEQGMTAEDMAETAAVPAAPKKKKEGRPKVKNARY